jgi:hypothetical protein
MRRLKMRKKIMKLSLSMGAVLTAGSFFWILGCGVKGDPLLPLKPSALGRGQPTYRKATEKIPLQDIRTNEDDSKQKQEPEDE